MNEPKVTEQSGFLDGQYYIAAFLYEFIGLLIGNGVYMDELATLGNTGSMSVTHGAGHAWINGVMYRNSTPFVLPIEMADGQLDRYDSLVIRLDLSSNTTYALIVQGEFATNPTAPQPVRNVETWDLKLCDIYVPAGCTEITQAQIFDTRLDTEVCGVPVFPVEHLDMTTFYQQIADDLANFREKHQAEFAAWVDNTKSSTLETLAALVQAVQDTSSASTTTMLALLAQLNDLVDADAVGQLVTQINSVDEKTNELREDVVALAAEDLNLHEADAVLAVEDQKLHEADAALAGEVQVFACVLLADGWAAAGSGVYTQTAACPGLLAGYDLEAPQVPVVGVRETDAALKEGLDALCEAGNSGETLDGFLKWTCYGSPPTVDLPLRLRRAVVDESGDTGEDNSEEGEQIV